jgi:3-deoxy-7-phosphoheptulonate synthase
MVESNLEAGSQAIPEDRSKLRYGVSVTDPCIDWRTTEDLLRRARNTLNPVLAQRAR